MNQDKRMIARSNFDAWWKHHTGITGEPCIPAVVTASRAWYNDHTGDLHRHVEVLFASGILAKASAKNHGVNVVAGYRENVGTCSAQIVVHEGGLIEMDFDIWRPWDVVNGIRHLFGEVLSKRQTDPAKVAQLLAKRGIAV